jgi:hypothetical protein
VAAVLAAVTLALVVIAAFNLTHHPEYRVICSSNLHQLGLALLMYADESGGCFPPKAHDDSWVDLMKPYLGSHLDEGPLYCLLDRQRTGRTSYRFVSSACGLNVNGLTDEQASKTVVLVEKRPFHQGGTLRGICYADVSVGFLPPPTANEGVQRR